MNINEEMKLAAAYAIASVISENELTDTNFIPDVFHPEVMKKETEASILIINILMIMTGVLVFTVAVNRYWVERITKK